MMHKLLHIDFEHLALNAVTGGTLLLEFATEILNSTGGLILTVSVVVLNLSKAYLNYRKGKSQPFDVCDIDDEDEKEDK
jgi:hypothetical protein